MSVAVVMEFGTRAEWVECPKCGHKNYGLLGDPRGREAECDECKESFTVSTAAEPKVE